MGFRIVTDKYRYHNFRTFIIQNPFSYDTAHSSTYSLSLFIHLPNRLSPGLLDAEDRTELIVSLEEEGHTK